MTEETCDPLAGSFTIGHVWAFCRGTEDYCVEATLVDVSETQAGLTISRTSENDTDEIIAVGSYKEYSEGDYTWRVYVDGVNKTMRTANVRICYSKDEIPDTPPPIGNATEMAPGDTVLDISLVRIICDKAQAVIEYGGRENAIGHVMKALLINPFIYVGVWWIDKECTKAYIVRADTTITPEAEQTAKDAAQEQHPTATPEEIDEASKWAKEQAARDADWQELLEQYRTGAITFQQMIDGQLAIYEEYLNSRLSQTDFTLSIPTLVMAGEVNVSGTTPQQNQKIEICATKKFFGFDFLAADDVLATVTSDAEYNYEATLTLDEFGIIEVYARIPQAWWMVLEKDLTTAKHTVFVLTWEIIIFLIIAAALIYDKQSGGKLGLLKRKK